MLAVAPGRRRRAAAALRSATASTSPTSASSPAPATSSCARAARRCSTCRRSFLHDGRPQRRMAAVAAAPIERRDRPPRRRPASDAARPARPPEHRLQGGRRPSLRPRDRRGDGRAPAGRRRRRGPRRRRRPRPPGGGRTASPSASASTRGTGCTTPRRWPPSPSTRRSATSSPSAPTPIVSPCSTTSRGATPVTRTRSARSSPPSPAAAPPPTRSAPRSCRARTRSTTPTPAPTGSATPSRRRSSSPPSPTSPTSTGASRPSSSAPGNVLLLLGDDGRALRRQPPRSAHRRPSHAVGDRPASPRSSIRRRRPGTGRCTEAIRAGLVAACHDVSEGGLAVALAEMCIASQLGASIDALPHADTATALFSESAGRLVVEVAAADVGAFTAIVGPVHSARHGDGRARCSTIDGVFDARRRRADRRVHRGGDW